MVSVVRIDIHPQLKTNTVATGCPQVRLSFPGELLSQWPIAVVFTVPKFTRNVVLDLLIADHYTSCQLFLCLIFKDLRWEKEISRVSESTLETSI
jgi:hypothetical protein